MRFFVFLHKQFLNMKPFLKWAGGKGQLLEVISSNLPLSFNTYVEPFVGSGAVLFDILSNRRNVERVVINDVNTDLINTYLCIKNNCQALIVELTNLQEQYLSADDEERTKLFYDVRDKYNKRTSSEVEQASFFIFLNRTCFNGLYRVNSNNYFNVPHGKYKNPKICDKDNLASVSTALKGVDIWNGDYEKLKEVVTDGCFVYLDPPYKPISETSAFTSYIAGGFGDDEQVRLKKFCDYINQKGAYFMLSNSDPASVDSNNLFFDDLYSQYHIQRVLAKRAINSNGNNRGEVNELLITNYKNEALLF